MNLASGEIRPGKVLSVEDNFGTIKASVVGLFSDGDDITLIPPIYPFLKTSTTSFSKPKVGDKIWVLFFRDNNQELFYFFQGDVNATASSNTAALHNPNGGDEIYDGDIDILLDRNTDDNDNRTTISFDAANGINILNGKSKINIDNSNTIKISNDSSSIVIKSNGEINIDANDKININGNDNISINSGSDIILNNGSSYHVAVAELVEKYLKQDLYLALSNAFTAADSFSGTSAAAFQSAISPANSVLDTKSPNIVCP